MDRDKIKNLVIALLAFLLVVAVVVIATEPTTRRGVTACSGTQVAAGASIQKAIASKPTGTTFCLAPGLYSTSNPIKPKDRDRFVGTADTRDGTVVRGVNGTEVIFDNGGTNDVVFRHFAITGGRNRCPGENCGPTGSGINQGTGLVIDDMHVYANGRNGIGGTKNTTVTNSEIDHNGAVPGDGVSGGIKTVDPMTVKDSYIHDNVGNGIWCDIQCGTYTATGNRVESNGATGIFIEISQGPVVVSGNTISNNNTAHIWAKGGMSLTDSKNADVYGNTFSDNYLFGLAARMDKRINCGSPDAGCGFVLSNINLHDNDLGGGVLKGCSLDGVVCSNNTGAVMK